MDFLCKYEYVYFCVVITVVKNKMYEYYQKDLHCKPVWYSFAVSNAIIVKSRYTLCVLK